ncbi:MAG: glycosyl transferase [Gemmatimonadota bacterium]|nr:glycosyl transferase [Gemmatimonadota bacterium]
MSDFYQHSPIATLHRLGKSSLDELEGKLVKSVRKRPVALVIPVTLEDARQDVFKRILEIIEGVPYIHRLVVTVGRTDDQAEYAGVCRKVKEIFPEAGVIWSCGPRISKLVEKMEKMELFLGEDGKGRSVWFSYGYIIGKGDCRSIALHDADIINYEREMLARLCFPVTLPFLHYEFCKGYYSRVTDRMYGRVTRLFVTPLIRSFKRLLGPQPFLDYMDAFRYPLAGEFSLSVTLARMNQVPGDWGLEVGTLAEVYRNCAIKRICQVDICDNYEHKHQELSQSDPNTGLARMAEDIAKVFFRTLASQGVVFTTGSLQSLVGIYRRYTTDLTEHQQADALLNGLIYDRHAELLAVDTFSQSLVRAWEGFMENPQGKPQIPSWNRVESADTAFLDELLELVDEDMKEAV